MMEWSYSTAKMFRRCQRQWFYYDRYANARTTDPQRNYAFALRKLTTIAQWRGMIVDQVVSKNLVENLGTSIDVTCNELKAVAQGYYDRQLACARRHPIIDHSFRPRDEPDFAVFYVQEYGPGINEAEVVQAREDVMRSLDNLFKLRELRDLRELIKSATHRSPQRVLRLPFSGMTVRGIPDLVLYHPSDAPTIIDWKVHALGELDAWQQLGIYSMLVAEKRRGTQPEEIRLLEVQLLLGEVREHRLEAGDVDRLRDQIADSVESMLRAVDVDEENIDQLRPEDFPRAQYAETCTHCAFVRLCWPAASQPKSPPWP